MEKKLDYDNIKMLDYYTINGIKRFEMTIDNAYAFGYVEGKFDTYITKDELIHLEGSIVDEFNHGVVDGQKDSVLRNIEKVQDDDGHWYWIPHRLLSEFRNELNEIIGKEYMDSPDEFDNFLDKYDKYQTGGDPDIMPDFFKKK